MYIIIGRNYLGICLDFAIAVAILSSFWDPPHLIFVLSFIFNFLFILVYPKVLERFTQKSSLRRIFTISNLNKIFVAQNCTLDMVYSEHQNK